MANTEKITINADGSVDKNQCKLSKGNKDQVVWKSKGGRFTVSFGRSPFRAATFEVSANGESDPSGEAIGDLGTYPYTIASATGGSDPDIIIEG